MILQSSKKFGKSYYYLQFKTVNEEGKTSCFISVNKIGEVLSTTIDLLVNTKGLPNKRLNESIEQSWHFKKKNPLQAKKTPTLH